MSERSLTIWKLLITFSVLSIVAGGFSIYPKNIKYQKIIAKSSRTFGTDKELENVIEYLEERLEQRGYYQFGLEKQPMRLTNVLTLADGSGPGSRRSRSALRVSMIYQSQKRFQAQLNYRGKIYTVSSGESVPSIGEVVHIDQKQVVMKRENKILSYPAPGTDRQNALEISVEDFNRGKI